ncbi:unnamed protein product [Ostreobium quekettii]|uniref:Secretory carrier-associated membrane protein n=1 Tax=Ostreobium quekettii TaxID=121088 RepID=A0A8S1J4H4_9CHLO|nr:unnamed protein product [Ostreobium quekettii]|eukprot:evm.model.scf_1804.1 EVM.evm.TU.scf_1804.1   scf_1804:1329-9205(+)
MSRSNPFSKEPNPFADPSVTQHTETEDDGGYDVPATTGVGAYGGGAGAYGAGAGAWSTAPPPPAPDYTSPRSPKNGSKKKERGLDQAPVPPPAPAPGTQAPRTKNFPKCWPLVYHDIDAEIPQHMQRLVRWTFWSYLLFVGTLVWNFFALLVSVGSGTSFVLGMLVALLFLVVGVPAAWVLWYRRIYNSAINDRAFSYMCFFMLYIVHIGFCVWGAIAPPIGVNKKAFAGFIRMIDMFDDEDVWLGVVYLIGFVLWTLCALVGIFLWSRLMTAFRTSGGIQQAQAEATRAVGRAAVEQAGRV